MAPGQTTHRRGAVRRGTAGLGCRLPAWSVARSLGGAPSAASHPGMWAVGGAARAGRAEDAVCQHLTECLSSRPVPLAGASVSPSLPPSSPDSFRRPHWTWRVRRWRAQVSPGPCRWVRGVEGPGRGDWERTRGGGGGPRIVGGAGLGMTRGSVWVPRPAPSHRSAASGSGSGSAQAQGWAAISARHRVSGVRCRVSGVAGG